jgi:predicted GNAT family N-acyltransferase
MHARQTAAGFYSKLGYQRVGDPFVEVTLPHIAMRKPLEGQSD